MQTTLARLNSILQALSEAKIEISGVKLTAAVGVGIGISRYVLGHTSVADVTTDVMTTVGTYVISTAAIQLSQGIRNQFVATETATSTTTSKLKAK